MVLHLFILFLSPGEIATQHTLCDPCLSLQQQQLCRAVVTLSPAQSPDMDLFRDLVGRVTSRFYPEQVTSYQLCKWWDLQNRFITLHVHVQADMWSGLVSIYLYIYIYIYMYMTPQKVWMALYRRLTFLNTRAKLLVEFLDQLYNCTLQKRFPHRVNQGFLYLMCTLLYLSERWHT